MSEKLWGGVFKKKRNPIIDNFTASISFDSRLAKYDIEGSIAHVKMLAKCKIIKPKDRDTMIKGLKGIANEKGLSKLRQDEDIHLSIERRLHEKIGKVAGKLHTARSRNDQIALDMRLYLRDEIKAILNLLKDMQKSILNLAERNLDVVMPGFTHLQHAQPVLFSHHTMTYFYMLQRDKKRLVNALSEADCLPLGAGALAGSTLPIDPGFVAHLLNFSRVCEHSIDAVSDRDFILEFLSAGAILMMHLSRLSEDLIIWASPEFDFLTLDETVLTGSSMMPQKKNPDIAELIRGKCGRVYGNLVNTLTMMKGLPLSYNRDMQEDKEALFDTVDTLKRSLEVYPVFLKALQLNIERIESLAEEGFTTATDLAEYLVTSGIPFRKAHEKVGKLILYCIKNKKTFADLSEKDFRSFGIGTDAREFLKPEVSVRRRKATSPGEVRRLIKKAKKTLYA